MSDEVFQIDYFDLPLSGVALDGSELIEAVAPLDFQVLEVKYDKKANVVRTYGISLPVSGTGLVRAKLYTSGNQMTENDLRGFRHLVSVMGSGGVDIHVFSTSPEAEAQNAA